MSFLLFVSCEDEEKNGKGVDYDPSKPVVLTSFHPDLGGIASKVIFDGENFGSDPGKIKVSPVNDGKIAQQKIAVAIVNPSSFLCDELGM
jgi:hypothetical protein